MIKRDRARRNNDNDHFRYYRSYRSLVANELCKGKLSVYDNNVSPMRKSCPKAWWKQIKKLIGKKRSKATILNPDTQLHMDDKWTANHINEFFANLTKDYPKVNNEWLELQCPRNLQLVSVEEVREELEKRT